ncbi:MAG TPA: amidohydrolase family protein [Desulfuromonadaceae bacterium]
MNTNSVNMPETIYSASWIVSPHTEPIEGGAILVRNGFIAATGKLEELRRTHGSTPVVDFPDCVLMPGLVNAHTHLELTYFPAWRLRTHIDYNPRRFVDWIIQLIKIKRGLALEDYQASIREGLRMCLEAGTTVTGEIAGNSSLAGLYHNSLLSGRLFFEVLGHDPVTFQPLLKRAIEACITDNAANFASGISPHSPYTIGEGNLSLIREEAFSRGFPLAIHISESAAESDFMFSSSGPLAEELYPFAGWERYLTPPRRMSSTDFLDRAGLLSSATLAIHCVHINLADAEILKKRGVHVALCPRSNNYLDVGRAPVALLKKLGIPLALGTDSLASNDSLSMWDEMRFALESFPKDLSALDVFRMATSNGAAALGLKASHGSLEPGKRADFQVIGKIGTAADKLLERAILSGEVLDVFSAGRRYAGIVTC